MLTMNQASCDGGHRMTFKDEGDWYYYQCLEGYSCMNAGIKVYVNKVSHEVRLSNVTRHNLGVKLPHDIGYIAPPTRKENMLTVAVNLIRRWL